MEKPIGLSREALRRALDPVQAVNARTLYGGPAPEQTRARTAEAQQRLEADHRAVQELAGKLEGAEQLLESRIDALISKKRFKGGDSLSAAVTTRAARRR